MDYTAYNKINPHKISLPFCLLFTIGISLMSSSVLAQKKEMNFIDIENKTYTFYQAEEWDSLIDYSKIALSAGHDYFYLRLRTGIAYFSLGHYFEAAWHLEKAHHFNAFDKTTIEYLFYAYLNSNRKTEAFSLLNKYKHLLDIPSKPKVNVNIETGPIFNNNISKNRTDHLVGPDSLFGEQNLTDMQYYNQIGFGFGPIKNTSFYLGYHHLIVSKLKQIQTSELIKTGYDTILDNGWFYVDTLYGMELTMHEDSYNFFQHGVYLNATHAPGNGWLFSTSVHWLCVNYKTIFAESAQEEYFAQSNDTLPSVKTMYTVDYKNTHTNNIVIPAGIYKTIKNVSAAIFGSYSNLNYSDQYQAGAEFTYFPKGNLNLYTSAKFVSAWNDSDYRHVFEISGGGRLFRDNWIEGNITFGRMINYNENDAYVVYSSGDEVKFRTGTNIIVPLSSEIEFVLRYQYLELSTNKESYISENVIEISQINYSKHLIIGGLKWKIQ
ncbi:MAG: hypothetical protein K8S16_03550 [Bacteroidales bacterium]|nr:hypothetical protein [Bacteroidales bacterium]